MFLDIFLAAAPLVVILAVILAMVIVILLVLRHFRQMNKYKRIETIVRMQEAGLLQPDRARELCQRILETLKL